ncbi:hypothetical protein ACW73L_20595 [Methylolobus aquaticus]
MKQVFCWRLPAPPLTSDDSGIWPPLRQRIAMGFHRDAGPKARSCTAFWSPKSFLFLAGLTSQALMLSYSGNLKADDDDGYVPVTDEMVKQSNRETCGQFEYDLSVGNLKTVKDYMRKCDNPIIDGTCKLAFEGFCVEGQGYQFPHSWKDKVHYKQRKLEKYAFGDSSEVDHKFNFTPIYVSSLDVFNRQMASKMGVPENNIYGTVHLDDAKRPWKFCNKGTSGNKHFAESGPDGLQPGDQVDLYSAPIFDTQPFLALRTHITGTRNHLNYSVEVIDNLNTYDFVRSPENYQRGIYVPQMVNRTKVLAGGWYEALSKLAYSGLKCIRRKEFEDQGERFDGYEQRIHYETRPELKTEKIKDLINALHSAILEDGNPAELKK